MKFAINNDGLYSHYGTDGTIEFDSIFNQNNQPFNYKYINGEWVADKDQLVNAATLKIIDKLDKLKEDLIYNETYIGTDSYETYKSNILTNISENRTLLSVLNNKTVEELLDLA